MGGINRKLRDNGVLVNIFEITYIILALAVIKCINWSFLWFFYISLTMFNYTSVYMQIIYLIIYLDVEMFYYLGVCQYVLIYIWI